ncbi:MAG: hypothetical protein NTW87_14570 [Planctomycetota bacterium]|nr:hypothetical protein [Planctomycetota bacterium]
MTVEQVRKLYAARPFTPFVMRLADGKSVRVPHPEWMSFSPRGRTVIVHQHDDSYEVVDLLLVTSVRVPANGKTAARK